jgi:spoIIIJ-associated protein
VRQGDDVMAEAEEEAGVPGQQEAMADEISADLADAEDVELDEADADEADADDVDDDDDAEEDDADDDEDDADDDEDDLVEVAAGETGGASGASDAGGDEAREESRPSVADLEQESEIAADYIEGLLDVADLDGDIDMDVEGERAYVSVVGATLDELVGQRGEVLEALQELTRLAVHRQTGNRTRIMLDVGGYRQQRRAELAETGRDAADEVKRTGEPKRLWAMNPFERKIVHDAVAAAGLRSESEGEEPDRRVVVLPVG